MTADSPEPTEPWQPESGPPHHGGRPDLADVQARRIDAARLRASGLPYRAIAERLGYSSVSGAHDAVMALLRLPSPPRWPRCELEHAWLDSPTAALETAVHPGRPARHRHRRPGVRPPRPAQRARRWPSQVEVRSGTVDKFETVLGELVSLVLDEPDDRDDPSELPPAPEA